MPKITTLQYMVALIAILGALVSVIGWLWRHRARAREQAEKVKVWIDRMTSPPPEARDQGLFLYILNDSADPVVGVRVEYTTGSCEIPLIAPGKEVHLGLDQVVTGSVEFTDAAGRQWKRPIGVGPPSRIWRRAPSR